jgi:hypothetical protein
MRQIRHVQVQLELTHEPAAVTSWVVGWTGPHSKLHALEPDVPVRAGEDHPRALCERFLSAWDVEQLFTPLMDNPIVCDRCRGIARGVRPRPESLQIVQIR